MFAGWDEIARLKEQLESHKIFGRSGFLVLALHSMVPAADQRRVFSRPPNGVRKVSLSLFDLLRGLIICNSPLQLHQDTRTSEL